MRGGSGVGTVVTHIECLQDTLQDAEPLQRNVSLGSQASGQGTPSSQQSQAFHPESQIVERAQTNGALHPASNVGAKPCQWCIDNLNSRASRRQASGIQGYDYL